MDHSPELRHPHDAFFKETFGRPEIAADFLRHYLPEAVACQLRLDALQAQRDSFIDPELQEHFSDLLYRVPLASGEQPGKSAYVYTLFEHKSYADKLVAFQLLRYMLRIWERHLRQEESPLPPIIPIVLYHGESRWQLHPSFDSLFTGPEELRPYWPSFHFQLTDLSHLSAEEIRGEVLLQAVMLLFKYIRSKELNVELWRIFGMVEGWLGRESGLQSLQTFLRYAMVAGEYIDRTELARVVASVAAQRGEKVMATIAQQLLEEGKQEGITQGIEQGREEGAQALRNTILGILRLRFDLSEQEQEAIARELAILSDVKRLESLNLQAFQDPSLEFFLSRLH